MCADNMVLDLDQTCQPFGSLDLNPRIHFSSLGLSVAAAAAAAAADDDDDAITACTSNENIATSDTIRMLVPVSVPTQL